jgi:hypothetical protein
MTSDYFIEAITDYIYLSGPDRASFCRRTGINEGDVNRTAIRIYNSRGNIERTRAILIILRNNSEREFWAAVQFIIEHSERGFDRDAVEPILNSEGYSYYNGNIVPFTGAIPSQESHRTLLISKLQEAGLDSSFVDQIEAGDELFSSGDDDAALARYRVVFEQTQIEIARELRRLDPTAAGATINYQSNESVMEFLIRHEVFTDHEGRILRALYSIISESGPHQFAWVTERSVSRFISVIVSSYLLFIVQRLIDLQTR